MFVKEHDSDWLNASSAYWQKLRKKGGGKSRCDCGHWVIKMTSSVSFSFSEPFPVADETTGTKIKRTLRKTGFRSIVTLFFPFSLRRLSGSWSWPWFLSVVLVLCLRGNTGEMRVMAQDLTSSCSCSADSSTSDKPTSTARMSEVSESLLSGAWCSPATGETHRRQPDQKLKCWLITVSAKAKIRHKMEVNRFSYNEGWRSRHKWGLERTVSLTALTQIWHE